ncbi:MAG: zinc ribbon domain-containing protein [Firmicutes bacterium]|nr:zinc ribbon domain-containing protein [Bacillota bacterium]
MTFCQNCGASLDPGAPACPRCGKPAAALPYPAYPYPAPYPPAYPAPKLPVTNLLAIIGFVMALLPLPALPLCIAGLVQCARTGQKGKGLAIAGILLRVAVLAVIAGGIVLLARYGDAGSYLPDWDWEDGFSFTVMLLGMR